MGKQVKLINLMLLVAMMVSSAGCQIFIRPSAENSSKSTANQAEEARKREYDHPLPDFNSMQFAWFYKPPENPPDFAQLETNYSLFILTRNDEAERDQLAEDGAQGDILQYLRFEAIMDPEDCQSKPFQNQAANLEGDFCQIKNNHPDWFLKDINNNPVRFNESGYFVMDPGNPDWQSFFQDRITGFQKDGGWKGIFLDNVDASLGRYTALGNLLNQYPDDKSFQDAIAAHLAKLSNDLRDKQHKLVFANITYLREPEVWLRYLAYLDGAMMEAFAADWDNGYISELEWLSQLEIAEKTQTKGKTIILVTQGGPDDRRRMLFGLASFLLVNNGQAYYRYSNDEAYRKVWWYPEFNIDLGQPLGPRYKLEGSWRRDFENGSVKVDLTNNIGEIVLN